MSINGRMTVTLTAWCAYCKQFIMLPEQSLVGLSTMQANQQAKKLGWKRSRAGWCCPNCHSKLATFQEEPLP